MEAQRRVVEKCLGKMKLDFKYQMFYNPGNPRSLVMLKDPQCVVKINRAKAESLNYIWMSNSLNEQQTDFIDEISSQLHINIIHFTSEEAACDFMKSYPHEKHMGIVTDLDFLERMNLLVKEFNIIQILFLQMPFQPHDSEIQLQQMRRRVKQYCNSRVTLLRPRQLKTRCRNQKNEFVLPAFVSLNDQTAKYHSTRRNIYAMLQQPTDSRIMFIQLIQLIKVQYPDREQQLAQFQQNYRSRGYMSLSPAETIKMYTENTFVHHLVNNLLRATTDPLEIFYIQPIVWDLHYSIKTIHALQAPNKQFVCYRGTQLSLQERQYFLTNIGKYLENLSFLSTSLSKETAITFTSNAFITIGVPEGIQKGQDESGFAFVEGFSQFQEEKQVLFNIQSLFRIKNAFIDGNNILQIELDYISIPKLANNDSQDEQLILIAQIVRKQKGQKDEYLGQDGLLKIHSLSHKLGVEYLLKLQELAQTARQSLSTTKFIALVSTSKMGLADIYDRMHSSHQAIIVRQKMRHIHQEALAQLKWKPHAGREQNAQYMFVAKIYIQNQIFAGNSFFNLHMLEYVDRIHRQIGEKYSIALEEIKKCKFHLWLNFAIQKIQVLRILQKNAESALKLCRQVIEQIESEYKYRRYRQEKLAFEFLRQKLQKTRDQSAMEMALKEMISSFQKSFGKDSFILNPENYGIKTSVTNLQQLIQKQDGNNFYPLRVIMHIKTQAQELARNSKFGQARSLFLLLLELIVQTYGINCQLRGQILILLAQTEMQMGNFDESIKIYKQAQQGILLIRGEKCLQVYQIQLKIARLYAEKKDFDFAFQTFEKCRLNWCFPKQKTYFQSLIVFGVDYLTLKRVQEAISIGDELMQSELTLEDEQKKIVVHFLKKLDQMAYKHRSLSQQIQSSKKMIVAIENKFPEEKDFLDYLKKKLSLLQKVWIKDYLENERKKIIQVMGRKSIQYFKFTHALGFCELDLFHNTQRACEIFVEAVQSYPYTIEELMRKE